MNYVLRRDKPTRRSSCRISEAQNRTGRGDVVVDGRHFETNLALSDAMLEALQAHLPLKERAIPRTPERHILFIAIDRDPPPRDIRVSSNERFLRFRRERLQEVHVAEIRKDNRNFELLDLVTFREIEER